MVNDVVVVSTSIIITAVIVVAIILIAVYLPKNNNSPPSVIIQPSSTMSPMTTKPLKNSIIKTTVIPPVVSVPTVNVKKNNPKDEIVVNKSPIIEKNKGEVTIKLAELIGLADSSDNPINSDNPILPEQPAKLDKITQPIFEEYNAITFNLIDKEPDVLVEPKLTTPCVAPPNLLDEMVSYWSETDSWGKKSFRDKPFDLSGDGAYYIAANNIIDEPGIIDVVEFNHEIHYLYNNNTIRVGNKKYRLHARETKAIFETIVAYGKHLLALADGGLYYLYKQKANRWSFRRVNVDNFHDIANIKESIIRISYGPYLVIQTEKYLHIFNDEGILVEKLSYLSTHKRIYGNKAEIYADIDLVANVAKLSTSRSRFTNVVDAIISNSGNLIPITTERYKETGYTGIRSINGEIYFLKG